MTDEVAHAFWVTGPGRGEIREERLPPPAAGEVLVRTLYSGISRGTESLVFNGRVPVSEHRRMRAPFQSGDFPFPVKYGYINVGRVEAGPEALRGRTVFSLYPHQTRFVVPADSVEPLPDGLPAERALLTANLQTAINGLWDAAPRVGDRVAVVGGGTLGCLAAWLAARMPGCDVELIDVDAARAGIAEQLSVAFRLPPDARRDADVVIHCSGDAGGLTTALELAGFEATVLEMSWYGDRAVEVPLGEAFHSRRLTLKSSQVATIAAAQRSRWDAARRNALAFELLRAPELDALITGPSPFEELPELLARLSAEPGRSLCHRIDYA